MRCRRVDVEMQSIIDGGGVLHAEEAQRFGALEMRCGRRDIEVWRSGGMELWSSSVLFVVGGISSFRSPRVFAPKRFASLLE